MTTDSGWLNVSELGRIYGKDRRCGYDQIAGNWRQIKRIGRRHGLDYSVSSRGRHLRSRNLTIGPWSVACLHGSGVDFKGHPK